MAITFENEKILFDDKYRTAKEIDCFLPVHLTIGGKENVDPQYKSCHKRTLDNQEITLHHLFFDFVSA